MSTVQTAILGAGCFWCIEAVYQKLKGVSNVASGYSGGTVENPSYQAVCTGTTGHAEVVRVEFDSEQIGFPQLLEIFFRVHDPTTLNRQGNDVGTQYRSAIFYTNDAQRECALQVIAALTDAGAFDRPIVTEVTPFTSFYPAEEYHRNYFDLHPDQAYCRAVVAPKVAKFQKVFRDLLMEGRG